MGGWQQVVNGLFRGEETGVYVGVSWLVSARVVFSLLATVSDVAVPLTLIVFIAEL